MHELGRVDVKCQFVSCQPLSLERRHGTKNMAIGKPGADLPCHRPICLIATHYYTRPSPGSTLGVVDSTIPSTELLSHVSDKQAHLYRSDTFHHIAALP